jgi:hypothetical protein
MDDVRSENENNKIFQKPLGGVKCALDVKYFIFWSQRGFSDLQILPCCRDIQFSIVGKRAIFWVISLVHDLSARRTKSPTPGPYTYRFLISDGYLRLVLHRACFLARAGRLWLNLHLFEIPRNAVNAINAAFRVRIYFDAAFRVRIYFGAAFRVRIYLCINMMFKHFDVSLIFIGYHVRT